MVRANPAVCTSVPLFPGNAEFAGRYNHWQTGYLVVSHAQSTSLQGTVQFRSDESILGALLKWRTERMTLAGSAADPIDPSRVSGTRIACERIVVFSKRDLVPEWGIEVWTLYAS